MKVNHCLKKEHIDNLHTFIKLFYNKNEVLSTIKLAMLHLALRRIGTSKMQFEIGSAGDGKAMEAILDRVVSGEENCAQPK